MIDREPLASGHGAMEAAPVADAMAGPCDVDASRASPTEPVDRERSTSLERGLVVLEVLLVNPFGLTLADIARESHLSRAAARRFLRTLRDRGYARQCGTRFVPTLRVGRLARCAITDPGFWALFEAPMQRLSDETGDGCSLAVLDGDEIEYVARSTGRQVLSVNLGPGSRLPACHTSMGRVLLASLPPIDRTALVGADAHPARTPHTLVRPDQVLDAIERAGISGHAVIDQELEEQLVSVAVPLRTAQGTVIAALNSSATASRRSAANLREAVVPRLEATSRQMSELLEAVRSRGWTAAGTGTRPPPRTSP